MARTNPERALLDAYMASASKLLTTLHSKTMDINPFDEPPDLVDAIAPNVRALKAIDEETREALAKLDGQRAAKRQRRKQSTGETEAPEKAG